MKGKELSNDFKKQTEELKNKDKKTFYEIFTEYKTVIYCSLFFAAGLLCGAFLYKKCATDVLDEIIMASGTNDFLNLFINNLGFYMLVFFFNRFARRLPDRISGHQCGAFGHRHSSRS